MFVASPYAVFKADRPLAAQSSQPPTVMPVAAPRRRPGKALAPGQSRAWTSLVQGNLFDPLPPL